MHLLAKHRDLPVIATPKGSHLLLGQGLGGKTLQGIIIEPLLDRCELPGTRLGGGREGGWVSFRGVHREGVREGGREGGRTLSTSCPTTPPRKAAMGLRMPRAPRAS